MQTEQIELQPLSSECLAALRPVRLAKTIAWLVVWVALAIQVICFVLVRFTSLLDVASTAAPVASVRAMTPAATSGRGAQTQSTSGPEAAANAATSPTTAPTPAVRPAPVRDVAVTGNDTYTVHLRRQTVGWLLQVTKFIGPVAALALMVFLMAAGQISLTGRLGGAGGFVSAFVWGVFLFLLLVPWQQYLGGWLAGALCSFEELQAAVSRVQKEWSAGQYYSPAVLAHLASFLLYPFLALLVWIIIGLRFAQGMKKVHESTSVAPPAAKPTSRPVSGY
jgi:hypothetical protein